MNKEKHEMRFKKSRGIAITTLAVAAVLIAGTGAASADVKTTPDGDVTIWNNEPLLGNGWHIDAGHYRLIMQSDGNLVDYFSARGDFSDSRAVWATNTNGWCGSNGSANAVMQSDGNLVVYPDTNRTVGTACWASGTNGHYGAGLTLSAQYGVLFVDDNGGAVWQNHQVNDIYRTITGGARGILTGTFTAMSGEQPYAITTQLQ